MTDKSFDLSMLLINAKIVQALGLAYSVHQPRSKDEMTKAEERRGGGPPDLPQLCLQLIATRKWCVLAAR